MCIRDRDGDTVKLGKVRFVNANDGTCEGIDYPELKAFTVQFHPEACTCLLYTSRIIQRLKKEILRLS